MKSILIPHFLISGIFTILGLCPIICNAATGGQYPENYCHGRAYGSAVYCSDSNYSYYYQIPIVTYTNTGVINCSICDPRYGSTIATYADCGQQGVQNGSSSGFYPSVTLPPGGITRAAWINYYYGRGYAGSYYSGGNNNYSNNGSFTNNYYSNYYNSSLNSGGYVAYPGDLVISGGDYNGDGVGDELVFDQAKKLIGINPAYVDSTTGSLVLAEERAVRTPSYARSSGIFFANVNGTNDWIGFLRAQGRKGIALQLLNPENNQIKRLRLDVPYSSKFRPIPVAQANGRDLLAIARHRGGDTELIFKDLRGRTVSKTTLSGTGEIVVGDYLDDPGEEVGVRNGGTLTIFSPSTGGVITLDAPSEGEAIDSIVYSKVPA